MDQSGQAFISPHSLLRGSPGAGGDVHNHYYDLRGGGSRAGAAAGDGAAHGGRTRGGVSCGQLERDREAHRELLRSKSDA